MDISPYTEAKSDQLNADDLIGRALNIKITNVSGDEDSKTISVHYEGDGGKPWKPCKSMLRVLVFCWGNDAKDWVGKSVRLFRDPEVMYAGVKVGGIRVSHVSHIDAQRKLALTARRGAKAAYKVEPLTIKEDEVLSPEMIYAIGEEAADRGTENYKAWFLAMSNDEKAALGDKHEELKKRAQEVDDADKPVF